MVIALGGSNRHYINNKKRVKVNGVARKCVERVRVNEKTRAVFRGCKVTFLDFSYSYLFSSLN